MPKKDLNQLAKFLVDQTTNETPAPIPSVAVESGRRGGLKGGKARAESLSEEERSRIAKKAAETRWHKNK
jgi:hypothetical protein